MALLYSYLRHIPNFPRVLTALSHSVSCILSYRRGYALRSIKSMHNKLWFTNKNQVYRNYFQSLLIMFQKYFSVLLYLVIPCQASTWPGPSQSHSKIILLKTAFNFLPWFATFSKSASIPIHWKVAGINLLQLIEQFKALRVSIIFFKLNLSMTQYKIKSPWLVNSLM